MIGTDECTTIAVPNARMHWHTLTPDGWACIRTFDDPEEGKYFTGAGAGNGKWMIYIEREVSDEELHEQMSAVAWWFFERKRDRIRRKQERLAREARLRRVERELHDDV